MASGTRPRDAGLRKPQRVKGRGLIDASLGVHSDQHGEHRLNLQQVYALEHLFQSSPAVQAARTVLTGQLLSGGISLRKEGNDVELTQQFRDHLSEVWIPFAGEVIDCFLKWGLVPISYEEHFDDVRNASLLYSKRQKTQPVAAPTGKRASKAAAAAQAAQEKPPPIIIPIVPTLGSYEIAYRMGGRLAYKREYVLYSNAPGQGTKEDDEARVIVRQHPDSVGNVNSPLASVFDLGSFIGALNELAITAEASRARPRITTQLRKKDAAALTRTSSSTPRAGPCRRGPMPAREPPPPGPYSCSSSSATSSTNCKHARNRGPTTTSAALAATAKDSLTLATPRRKSRQLSSPFPRYAA